MSAELTEVAIYSWYCADCGEGGTDWDEEWRAQSEMDEHNEEEHA